MARNSSGVYSLPPAFNPVVTLTKITTAWANNTLADVAGELTNSLDRNGRGAMLARLQLISGNSANTAVGTGNANNGFFWSGSDLVHAIGGVETFRSSTNEFFVPPPGGGGSGSFVGYRRKAGRSFEANYTTVAADDSRILLHIAGDSARTLTIDNANGIGNGAQMTVFNPLTSGIITLNITGGTLTRLSTGATGSRSIAPGGYALLERINNNWYITVEFGVT